MWVNHQFSVENRFKRIVDRQTCRNVKTKLQLIEEWQKQIKKNTQKILYTYEYNFVSVLVSFKAFN